jgi:predicted amidohydrolase YtcJ
MLTGRQLCIVIAGIILSACTNDPADRGADIVFHSGAVYTVNADKPWASAVAVTDGKITYVGDDAGVTKYIGLKTEVNDLAGKMLIPGFHDSHMHPMAAGTRFLRCNLEDLAWPGEVTEKIRQCALDVKPGQWFRGVNLDAGLFEDNKLHRSMLDELLPELPAFVTSFSGKPAWVNSRTLAITGIDRSTPDPVKGVIDRDPVSVIPPPHTDDLRKALRLASEMANRLGITSSNEASMKPEHHAAYLEAEAAGELTIRVQGSQSWDYKQGPEQINTMVKRSASARGGMFTANSVKFFLDGSGNRTGALLEPFTGTKEDFGSINFSTTTLKDLAQQLDALGFQLHMHAYYDAAVRQGLDAIEHVLAENPEWDRRHQLAHIALIDPSDIGRFKELGVTADIQALWAYLGTERLTELTSLGDERARRLLAFKSLFASGARVVAGSDWISESMNPLYSIQVAVTRRPPDGSGPAWIPDERVSLAEMIEAYTINGAWLANLETKTGSIEVGKYADLIVLEQNLFETDPMKLKDVRVVLTLLEGKKVHRDPQF